VGRPPGKSEGNRRRGVKNFLLKYLRTSSHVPMAPSQVAGREKSRTRTNRPSSPGRGTTKGGGIGGKHATVPRFGRPAYLGELAARKARKITCGDGHTTKEKFEKTPAPRKSQIVEFTQANIWLRGERWRGKLGGTKIWARGRKTRAPTLWN